MTKEREALKLALEALGPTPPGCCGCEAEWQIAIDALRRALMQPAQDVQYTGNGTAGREADVKPTGFFFQSPRQAQQEPVAYLTKRKIGGTEGLLRADMVDRSAKNQETHDFIPLYNTQPQRTWVGLTDEEIMSLLPGAVRLPPGWSETVRAIEAKLKQKNGFAEEKNT